MNETPDPLLGRVIKESASLRLKRKLGEGNFGFVYEAEYELLEQLVAVKILRTSLVNDPEAIGRFTREARIIGGLNHPNIVRTYDFGNTHDGIYWISFELIRGETLAQRIEREPLTEDELGQLLMPSLRALAEAHEKGVVHRDLTPKNIMLREQRATEIYPCILDFGLASLCNDTALTLSTFVSGTPRYMPPEQWLGLKYAEPRSDLYSLGMIAYEALTGSLPFTANSPISWMRAHQTTPPKPLIDYLPRATTRLHSAIMKTLAKDPNDRFSCAKEFLAYLQK